MTFSVDFDNQSELGAVEIHDVAVDRFLAEKLESGELSHAKHFTPDFYLCRGWILAILTGQSDELFIVREKGALSLSV